MHMNDRQDSIYFRLFRVLILAAVVSAACFMILNTVVEKRIDRYVSNPDYREQENNARIESLQDYVRRNGISTGDWEALDEWVKKQAVLSLQVYRNSILMYDSNYTGEEDIWEGYSQSNYFDLESYYVVEFKDGDADVILFGFYAYQYYNYALIAEVLFSCLLFLCIVMLGIRKMMNYIRLLSREIEILEGGNLDYTITVKGRDELAALARGLDHMRQSFKKQVEQEALLTQANRKMITEMSHDLRTPLTALLLYAKVLQQHKYRNEEQMWEYVDRIELKANQIKKLSDNIFEYALITGEEKIRLEEPETFRTVFYDLLSETSAYLEQKGFQVQMDLDGMELEDEADDAAGQDQVMSGETAFETRNCPEIWQKRYVCIYSDYVTRIFDNITSNIIKYANRSQSVRIRTEFDSYSGKLIFENNKSNPEKKEESTNIGIQNMKNMMRKMNGGCEVEQDGELFRIILSFAWSEKMHEKEGAS